MSMTMTFPTILPLDGSVCKLKGLPFKATPEDCLQFFSDFNLQPEQVYIKRHPDGRPNGEAFIVFESPNESRRATQKDREVFGDKFGDRYVRVYPTLDSDLADMQIAVQQQCMMQQGTGHLHGHMDSVVKIKSLPFDATQLDIIQFFEAFRLKPNGVQLVTRNDNKPTGEAFVDFESPEEAARSIRERDHKVFSEKFGDRYVRLIQVSRKEMQATLALRFGGEGILKMKGIPFKAMAADVRKFFSGFRIKMPDGISFIMHADGRPTGMAFIEFETPQEAVRAMEKDRAKFGPEYGERFCMLQLVGRHEMDKVQLQRESEMASNSSKQLGNMNNMLQAAALANATQAALGNPLLMGGSNPWLQLGLMNSTGLTGSQLSQLQLGQHGTMGSSGPLCNSSMLDAMLQLQLSSSERVEHPVPAGPFDGPATLFAGAMGGRTIPPPLAVPVLPGPLGAAALNGLPPPQPAAPVLPLQAGAGLDMPSSWMAQVDPASNPLLFYQNAQSQEAHWMARADPRFAQLSHM